VLTSERRVSDGGEDGDPSGSGGGGARHRAVGRGTGPRIRITGPRSAPATPPGVAGDDADEIATGGGGGPAGETRRLLVVVVGVAVLVGVLTCLYGWTVTSLRPYDLPVLAAGPAGPARALAEQLSTTEPGALRVRVVADGDAADRALRAREAYAAFVIGPSGLSLHVASAASPAVSEAIQRGIAQVMPTADIPVVDVVPNATADHVGGGLSAGYLPLVLVVAVGGVLLSRATARRGARLAGLAALALTTGAAGAAALRYVLVVLPGSYWAAMGVLTLLAVAVAGTVVGLGARAGTVGMTGAFVFFVVAAALSAWSSAPELMPPPWGTLGQLAPPGAGVTLLRSAAYFRGCGGGDAAAVLTVWAALGVALVMIGETHGWQGRPWSRSRRPVDQGPDAPTGPAGFPGIPLPVEPVFPPAPTAGSGLGGSAQNPAPIEPHGRRV
jgi:hypothetical protein